MKLLLIVIVIYINFYIYFSTFNTKKNHPNVISPVVKVGSESFKRS